MCCHPTIPLSKCRNSRRRPPACVVGGRPEAGISSQLLTLGTGVSGGCYAGETRFASAQDVITAAHAGDSVARQAIRTLVGYLARGCASLVHVLDPELLVLGGGLAEGNQLLLEWLPQELDQRAAAVARERIRADAS